jgi:hypothetical protein
MATGMQQKRSAVASRLEDTGGQEQGQSLIRGLEVGGEGSNVTHPFMRHSHKNDINRKK